MLDSWVQLKPTSVRSYPGPRCPLPSSRSRISLALSLPRGALALPSPCFSRALSAGLRFETRGGRGSGMRYFQALAHVPLPPGRCGRGHGGLLSRVAMVAVTGQPGLPSQGRSPNALEPPGERRRRALTARPATRGRLLGAGLGQFISQYSTRAGEVAFFPNFLMPFRSVVLNE